MWCPAVLLLMMELAEQSGLSRLIGEHVDLPSTRVASGAVNPAGREADLDHRGHDVRRGQHRRCERVARRRHAPGPHFRSRRHLLSAPEHRQVMADSVAVWTQITGATTTDAS
jgi:hypothetical protein